MAQSFNLNCKCGYNKSIIVGEGMLGMDFNTIRRTFTPEERIVFEESLENNTLKDFSFGQRAAYCATCNDIVSVAVLRCVVNEETLTYKPCPDCSNAVQPRDEFGKCPECGEKLNVQEAGRYD
jgi:hypothetical protein